MASRRLIFHQIHAHLQKLIPGQSNFDFFQDNGKEEEGNSIGEWGEHEIIKWILDDEFSRQHIIGEIVGKSKNHRVARQIAEPIIEKGELPGDVDIVIWEDGEHQHAVAIECKRVKVTVENTGKEKVNKLTQIEKGIKQATQLRLHNFHKTYLLFLILTDGRNKTGVNTLFRHADGETLEEVYNVPWHADLHPDVGVIYVQITQPTGRHISEHHGLGICVDKRATEIQQSEKITSRIKELEAHANKLDKEKRT